MKPITETVKFPKLTARFTWHETEKLPNVKPITQSYAFAYTNQGKLVIGKPYDKWTIPGGTIEPGENPEQTLIRELDEELSLKVLDYKLMGYQKAENLTDNETVYQLRYFALVELKELTPDPDYKILWERKLIEPEDFLKYIKWKKIGKRLQEKSKEIFEKIK